MNDLNDLYYFAMVVDHGGFAAAERALGIPKSRLSRRISQLETDLGVRLLQRSTRRFAVTDVGTSVHRHAQTMLAEAQAAREVVDRLSAEPREPAPFQLGSHAALERFGRPEQAQAHALALEGRQQRCQLVALATVGDRQHHVLVGHHAQVAMQTVGGV